MIVWPSERRRAESFASWLDGSADWPDSTGSLAVLDRADEPDLTATLLTVRRLAQLEQPQLDSDARAAMRRRLLAVAAVQGPGTEPDHNRSATARAAFLPALGIAQLTARGTKLVAAGAGVAVVAGVIGTAVVLSGQEPGQVVAADRPNPAVSESAQHPDAPGGETRLDGARSRLAAAARSETVGASLASTLMDMDTQTKDGVALLGTIALMRHEPQPLTSIDSFVAEQRARLDDFSATASQADRARIAQSRALLDRVEIRVAGWREAIRCGDYGNVDDIPRDDLGPVPPGCGGNQIPGPGRATTYPNRPGGKALTPDPSPASPRPSSSVSQGPSPSPSSSLSSSSAKGGQAANNSTNDAAGSSIPE